MSTHAIVTLVVFFLVLLGTAYPLGLSMARVYEGKHPLVRWLGPVERALYRAAGVREDEDMPWTTYARAVLVVSVIGVVVVHLAQRLQGFGPGLGASNPDGLGPVSPEVSFNTAISFVSNTNWQAYGGETTMSYATQALALTVQNFLSAATGMAVLVGLIRGFAGNERKGLGNFWVDFVRSTLYVLLPLSIVLAILLVSQGVVQTFSAHAMATLVEPTKDANGAAIVDQTLALGPAASQIAIKQLGTNGGGFFNVNSAHPFENPTPFSNFLEVLAILMIPAALCFTFGEMVKDRRQGAVLFVAMTVLFVPFAILCIHYEEAGTPMLAQATDVAASALQSGGNMEGKEARFGAVDSALWATVTTAASNGSVNSMHDSFTPLGGLAPLALMQLGEIVFGGVGSGLYGMLAYAILAVFIAGLMVGRTPEYLGKKIEAFEMKMASLVILFPAGAVLIGTAIACSTEAGTAAVANPKAHGFTEILYAFSSGANNNGSAFGGLTVSGPFYATAIGIAMMIGRFGVIVPILAIAGSLAKKKKIPESAGTLPTHTPLFAGLLVGTVLLVGLLTFVPALALGPVVEHLSGSVPSPAPAVSGVLR